MIKFISIIFSLFFIVTATQAATRSQNQSIFKTTPNSNAAPVVYYYQKSASAGDVVYFYGANLENASAYLNGYGKLNTLTRYGSNGFDAIIPANATGALIAHVGVTPTSGPALYLNQAQPYGIDSVDFSEGSTIHVMGKNFGSSPVVKINGVTATVVSTNTSGTVIQVTAPASGLSNGNATITVDNGNGSGSNAMVQVPTIISGSSSDPFGLSVGWASKFSTISGTLVNATSASGIATKMSTSLSDNTAALISALSYMSSIGGGVLCIPGSSTSYTFAPSSENFMVLPSNTVIAGGAYAPCGALSSGSGVTTLAFNGIEPAIYASGQDSIGLLGLSITQSNASGSTNSLIFSGNTHAFIKQLTYTESANQPIYAYGNTDFAFETNVLIGYDTAGNGGLYAPSNSTTGTTNCDGLSFTGNSINYQLGAFLTLFGCNDVYIGGGNLLNFYTDFRNGGNTATTHGIALAFNKRMVIDGNTFEASDGQPYVNVGEDMEAILDEAGGPTRTEHRSTVTSATLNTLTDSSANFSTTIPSTYPSSFTGPYVVVIISGTGAGQKRTISSNTSTQLTVSTPWNVIPDSTSNYYTAIQSQTDLVISNNTFGNSATTGWPAGPTLFYSTSDTVDIINNTMQGGGGIAIVPQESTLSNPYHNTVFDINVRNNSITGTPAITSPSSLGPVGAYVALVQPVSVNLNPEGLAGIGVTFKNNTITSNGTTLVSYGSIIPYPGFGAYIDLQATGTFVPNNTPSFVGTIFQGNTCSNATNCPTMFNSGTAVYGTVFYNNTAPAAYETDANFTYGSVGSTGSYKH